MHALFHDLRFALRIFLRNPGYTIVAVLTLALAIGANTAIFSAVYTVVLRPMPFHDAERLYIVSETQPDIGGMPVSYLNWLDYQAGQASFSGLGAVGRMTVNLTGTGEPERLTADLYSPEVLPTLAVEPALGRNFLPEENVPNGPKAAILSHNLWKRSFAADPAILGRTITLDREPWTVVGVLPANYEFVFENMDLIVPIGTRANEPYFADRTVRNMIFLVGRLKDGVTAEQAAADLNGIGESIAERFPANFATCRPKLDTLRGGVDSEIRPALLLLMGAVFCVLLIAAANVANLMLERAMTRQREMGIRAALGASRWRLIRQLLVESVLLALAGGALGLLVALWGVDLLTALRPQMGTAIFGPIGVDGAVLGFTLAVALGTGLLFGLVPAIYATRHDLAQALKDADHHATSGGRHLRARNVLVVVEVALALALLVTSVLAVRGLVRLQALDPGFAPAGLLHARVSQPLTRFKTVAEAREFWLDIRRRVAAIPGVTSVSITAGAPIVGASLDLLSPEGVPVGMSTSRIVVSYMADEHFLSTLKVPLLAGRAFGPQDVVGSEPVLIIDEATAEEFFPGQDPIGKRLHDRLSERPSIEVVGVVGTVTHFPPGQPPIARYQMYYTLAQLPEAAKPHMGGMSVLARTEGDPRAIVSQLRATVAEVEPNAPLHDVVTLDEALAKTFAAQRYTITVLGIFAGLALLLAAIGLYAVMASTVVQRTHELGVRMALGAQPRAVVALVVRQGMTLVGIGVVVGIVGAVGLTRVMASVLTDQISATDPGTYLGVTAFLLLVGLLATYIPARRATRIDPMVALRHE